MRAVTIVVISILAVTFAACGDDDQGGKLDHDAAGVATQNFVKYALLGQSGKEWDTLIDAQKSLLDRNKFMECRAKTKFAGELKDTKVADAYDEPASIPGTNQTVDTVAVTVAVTYRQAGVDSTQSLTMHAYPVGKDWRWALNPTQFDGIKNGTC